MAAIIYKDIFDSIDKDHSGFIDRSQLRTAIEATFNKSGLPLSQQAVQYQLDQFDKNNDGKISLKEYAAVMSKYHK